MNHSRDCFYEYLNKARVSEQHVLEKVIISDKSGNGGMEVDSGSPISLCEEFNAKYVTFFVCMGNPSACEVQPAQKNAFQVLMNATKARNHLPASIETEHRQLIATERVHNQVLIYMRSVGAGFTRDMVESVGHRVVRALKDALWYIDTAHQQFQDRGIRLPEAFKRFQGFNEYQKNRKSKPRMSAEKLTQHSQELAGLLMLPSLSASNCIKLRADIEALSNALHAYSTYLNQHNEQQQHVNSSLEPVRDPAVDSVARIVSAGSTLMSTYVSLQSHMDTVLLYEPVCVNEFAPIDRFERQSFINNLSLSLCGCVYVSNGLRRFHRYSYLHLEN